MRCLNLEQSCYFLLSAFISFSFEKSSIFVFRKILASNLLRGQTASIQGKGVVSMKKTVWLFAAVFFAGFAGCAQDTDLRSGADSSVQLAQGLTLQEVTPAKSFKAVYVKGNRAITLEAVRGRMAPEPYLQDPSFPMYEIDARILDETGHILYLRRGGDDFVNPQWQEELAWRDDLPAANPGGNREYFEMMAEAARLLQTEFEKQAGLEAAVEMTPEIEAVVSFGHRAMEAFETSALMAADHTGPKPGDSPILAGGGGTNGPEDAPKYFDGGWYLISVHTKGIAWDFGEHSATRIQKWLGTNWFAYYDFCNHGTCASSMGMKCGISFINKPAWTALTCSTGYDWDSEDGGHNCHDDTRVQLASFVYGPSMERNWYWCNDGDSDTDISVDIWGIELDQDGSPECNDSTNRGYTHPWMNWYSASNTNSATVNGVPIQLTLAAGATYTISTCGSTSTDTYLRLYYNGSQVSYNDDACGLQSSISITAPYAGVYTLYAGCWGANACSGQVRVTLTAAPLPPCQPAGYRMCPGEELLPGQSRVSADGRFRWIYQTDGNLVLYLYDSYVLWAANLWGYAPGRLVMQTDGNLVVYNASWQPVWSTNTGGYYGTFLDVQNDGNVVMYSPYGWAIAATGTGGY